MFKAIRRLVPAAGLWLMASAVQAAPQATPDMPLGPSAMAPAGFLAFCERRPLDCGADPAAVRAGVKLALAERAELLSKLAPANVPAPIVPASIEGQRQTVQPALAELTLPEPILDQPAVAAPDPTPSAAEASVQVDSDGTAPADVAEAPRVDLPMPPPSMTPALWSMLNRVNAQVNSALRQQTDMQTYGVDDYWNTPLEDGLTAADCEDFVLEKQRALVQAGLPRSALNIALVQTPWGESHAVLLVATSEGEFVLDNLSGAVSPWRDVSYHWVRREVNGDAFDWVMVSQSAEPALQGGFAHKLLFAFAR